jgi:hypothetical protein
VDRVVEVLDLEQGLREPRDEDHDDGQQRDAREAREHRGEQPRSVRPLETARGRGQRGEQHHEPGRPDADRQHVQDVRRHEHAARALEARVPGERGRDGEKC